MAHATAGSSANVAPLDLPTLPAPSGNGATAPTSASGGWPLSGLAARSGRRRLVVAWDLGAAHFCCRTCGCDATSNQSADQEIS